MTAGGILEVTGTFDNRGQTVTLDTSNGTFLVDGSRILGGTVTGPAGSVLSFVNSNSDTLDGVTLNLAFTLDNQNVRIDNGLTLNATATLQNGARLVFEQPGSGQATLAGTGTVLFGNGAQTQLAIDGTTTLTIGPGITLQGHNAVIGGAVFTGGTETLINQGTITADGAGTLVVEPNNFNNQGTVVATNGGTLSVSNFAPNTGTITADVGRRHPDYWQLH